MIVSSPIQKSVRYKKLERSHFYQADFWSQTGRKRCERGHGIETHVKTVTVGILGQLMHKKMPQTGRQRCGRLMDLKKPGKSDLSQAYYNGHFFEWASWQKLKIWVQLVQKSVCPYTVALGRDSSPRGFKSRPQTIVLLWTSWTQIFNFCQLAHSKKCPLW